MTLDQMMWKADESISELAEITLADWRIFLVRFGATDEELDCEMSIRTRELAE